MYEYFLGQFADAEGKKGGQFYTPRCIVKLLVEMLEPYKGRVFDPCCGSGGMFVQSEKFVQAHGGKIGDISIYGQESNQTTWRLCKMNLAIRGIDANIAWNNEGSFLNDAHKDLKADFVIANPPFNDKELTEEDVAKIAVVYHAWRGEGGKYADVKGFCKVAKIEEIRKHEHILTPGRYVGSEDIEDDDEAFAEKMKKLTLELSGQFKKSKELEGEIKKNLHGIGYELMEILLHEERRI